MKIAFLCNNVKSLNGVERVLSQRLSLLAESGQYDVYLITYNQYGAPFSFPISDKVHCIDLATRYISRCSYHGLYQYWDRYISKKVYKRAIHQCLESLDPDIVTCMDMHIADLEAVLSLKTKAKQVVECHSGLSAYYINMEDNLPFKRMLGRLLRQHLIRTIKRFDKVIVMTTSEQNDWNLEEKVRCIPNILVDYPSVISDKSLVRKRVISVGRYAYQKGYDMLVESWKIVQEKHPDWSLHIYGSHDGDNGEYRILQNKIENSKINNVFLHPSTTDIYTCYCDSDIYVMSSRYESFGLVLIEAMSCGLPVISFDCKYGPGAIVKDGVTGLLVPANDIVRMAEAICTLIENKDERQRMAQNARVESAKYLSDHIMPLWYDFYESLGTVHPTAS